MLLVIDNYDSFTYNLVQYLGELGAELAVHRNDEITVDEAEALAPAAIVLSPGPGAPAQAGISPALISRFAGRCPILGVCLGHQAIGEVFGGRVGRAPEPIHGKTSWIHHDGQGLFEGLPNPFEATRYHSLLVHRDALPDCLAVSAWTADGLVMGLRHRRLPVDGVQFHPESILTSSGQALLRNFLDSLASPPAKVLLDIVDRECVSSGPMSQPGELLAAAERRCPACRTKIVVADGAGVVVRNAILRVSETGTASAKCPRCKAWVEVPLRYCG